MRVLFIIIICLFFVACGPKTKKNNSTVAESAAPSPAVSIDTESLVGITISNAINFVVTGSCSEEGQSIIVSVGDLSPETAPSCMSGSWEVTMDVSGLLTGASRPITITADHSTSGGLVALQASHTVTLYPRVSIAASVGNITGSTFTVNGACSENGQAVTVDVGGVSPATAPTCISGSWSVNVDVSSLGASGEIDITADHSTSGSSPLNATQASHTVTLYPRVSIAASVGNITGDTFTVNGACSENGQPVTVDVGGVSPATVPTCTSGSWSTSVDVSGLTGASRPIAITADHSTSGSSLLNATQANKTVTLYPRVSIAASVGNITGDTFTVNGACSENGQPVTVDVGGVSPATAPTCTSGSWSTSVDVSSLGASGEIDITADHSTSGSNPLNATQASHTVTLYPRVSIAASVGNITGDTFTVNGACSENGQPVTVDVGGVSPATVPTCTSGSWSTSVDVSGLTGASRPIAITADHSTSGSSLLNATQANKTVTLYPRVSIAASVGNITGDTFTVNGACSENGQPVTVDVGGVSPATAPTCTSGSWSTSVDVSSLLTGASRPIAITADHSTSGSNPLNATQASHTVTLYPRVSIAASVGNITGDTFTVNGACSENGQPVTVDVGGVSPATAPTCTSGSWSVNVDVSSLGASGEIDITADHSTSGSIPLDATQASHTVTLYPRVSIAASVGNITGDTFTVNGACSENGQPVTVDVGGVSPATAPTCTSGSWSTSVDVSSLLTGASRPIAITADHSTSGSNPLNAIQASHTVTLYPRVSIAASVGNITGDTFTVNGACSENGQPVTVDVGGVSPATAPTCTSGSWSVNVDVSSLGASGEIDITADHSTSGSIPLDATQASHTVTLYPRVTLNIGSLADITSFNAGTFSVSGTCSEDGQPVEVSVGTISALSAPTCTTGAWSVEIDVSALSGTSVVTAITADHSTSGDPALSATQATANVLLNPTISINSRALENITSANAARFVVTGHCSEEGEPVEVSVNTTILPQADPNCTNGAWSVEIDVTGLNQTQGAISITADHSSSGGSPHPQATASVTNDFTCPSNYVGVPALAGYTTNSFCVMKYEAKSDSGDAVSQASGSPYVNINRTDSIDKCTALGESYDLITNDEWQSLARNIELVADNWATGSVGNAGGLSRGHSDNIPSRALAASSNNNEGCFETFQSCDLTNWHSQRRTHTLSNGNIIWDVAGNVRERVKDTNNHNYGTSTHISLVTTTSHSNPGSLTGGTTTTSRVAKAQFGSSGDYTSLSAAPHGGLGRAWLNFNTGGVIRGGYWSAAGVFETLLFSTVETSLPTLGFRCAYHP